ncbi:MAG: hypothetical protein ACP5SH_17890 [Syntrophobacteraceae bacterium]
MGKNIILGVLLASFAFTPLCRASMAGNSAPPAAVGSSQDASVAPASGEQVVTIQVSKIENSTIYAQDGRQFALSGATVQDESSSGAGAKTAELHFDNGKLARVILK